VRGESSIKYESEIGFQVQHIYVVGFVLRFWSCLPPPETEWFPVAPDHNFRGIVFIVGIHLWGVKGKPPTKNGHDRVISPFYCTFVK
jgi:hypothetical protein